MGQKIRVSKSGFNVLTETSLDNVVYDSDYDTLKYYVSGSVNTSTSGSDVEVEVSHNLGYIPFFVAIVNIPTVNYNMCPGILVIVTDYASANVYSDVNTLYFKIHTNITISAINFRYFIFRNKINL